MSPFKMQADTIVRPEDPKHVKQVTDKNMQRIYTAHQTLDGTAIKAGTRGAGFAANSGSESVTGSKLGIASGLTLVEHVVVSIDNGATATNFWVTARVTPTNFATFDIFVWKPTAAGNNTPIAATTPVVVKWWCTGTSTQTQ